MITDFKEVIKTENTDDLIEYLKIIFERLKVLRRLKGKITKQQKFEIITLLAFFRT